MEIATKESILSLLNSTDSDDVKLGIIVLLRQAENQKEITETIPNYPSGLHEFSYWRCKDKWLFVNGSRLIANDGHCSPDRFSYNNIGNIPVIHEVYDPE
jgi:hypothetical protein